MINLMERAGKGILSLGLYITMPEPQIVEMAKVCGYDFARLDAEHVNFDPGTLREMFRTARLLDFPLQIRLGSMENMDTILALEPAAVMVPDIQTKQAAEMLVHQTKFSPLGQRGMYAFTDAIRFGGMSRQEYLTCANEAIHTIVQIESREGLENLDEILSVPGIDMVSSGKADLSQALGIPGQTKDPRVAEAEERIVKAAVKAGKVPTLFAESPERIRTLRGMGVNCFIVGFDSALCMTAMKERLELVREKYV